MSADVAFDPGTGIEHGLEAIRRIPIQLWLGGGILTFTDSGGSGCSSAVNPAQLIELMEAGGTEGWDGGGFDYDFTMGLEGIRQASFLQEDPLGLLGLGVAALFGMMCCFLGIGLVLFGLRCFLMPGWYRLHQECLRTGDGEFSPLLGGQDLFLKMLLWHLLKALILGGVTLVCLTPAALLGVAAFVLESVPVGVVAVCLAVLLSLIVSLYVRPGLAFGAEAITFDGLGVMDGLARSWDLARGLRMQMILFFVVMGLVNAAAFVVGLCACGVGVFVTAPLARGGTDLAATRAYLILTRGVTVADDWTLLSPGGPDGPGPVAPAPG